MTPTEPDAFEDFLAAHAPEQRRAHGAWYTPEPVAAFVVRTLDTLLRVHGGFTAGLTDTATLSVIDPAVGTGRFLHEIVRLATARNAPVPALHGIEVMPCAHALCLESLRHLTTGPRMPTAPQIHLGDAQNRIETLSDLVHDRFPCVIGNPPYLAEAGAASGALAALMADYKKEPGGREKLRERNPKWLNDLYVRFLRLSSHLVETAGRGAMGLVLNHGFLDNPTFRGVRWHLLSRFDAIWVLDLHGNAKKKEVPPDGGADQNLFDIQQGVALLFAIKTGDDSNLADLHHGELWGTRRDKLAALQTASIQGMSKPITPLPPHYAFIPQDPETSRAYEDGFSIADFMPVHGNGIVTKRDKLTVHHSKEAVARMCHDILQMDEAGFRAAYRLPKDVRDWRYEWAKRDVSDHADPLPIIEIGYRLFDRRFLFYSGRSRGLIGWPVSAVMQHYLRGPNIGLLTSKAHRDGDFAHVFLTDKPTEAIHFSAASGSNAMNFPLYLYSQSGERRVNIDPDLGARLTVAAGGEVVDEVHLFDYVYGVLHDPAYRRRFATLLKTGFPRIPWPETPAQFKRFAKLGEHLRKLHLLEPEAVGDPGHSLTGPGDGTVVRPRFEDGHIWINRTQAFENVTETVWRMRIGGYHPARKWLQDRKRTQLIEADIRQYRTLLTVLHEMDRLIATICSTPFPQPQADHSKNSYPK